MIFVSSKWWRRRYYWPLWLVLLIVIGVLVIITIYNAHSSLLPPRIKHEVSFVIYYPPSTWTVEANSVNYSTASGAFSMVARQAQQTLIISEQATPSQFSDIPSYYSTLLNKLNEYQSSGSVNGTFYLTKPTELHGGQSVVLNNNGTLVFIEPSSPQNLNFWQTYFNATTVIKP